MEAAALLSMARVLAAVPVRLVPLTEALATVLEDVVLLAVLEEASPAPPELEVLDADPVSGFFLRMTALPIKLFCDDSAGTLPLGFAL